MTAGWAWHLTPSPGSGLRTKARGSDGAGAFRQERGCSHDSPRARRLGGAVRHAGHPANRAALLAEPAAVTAVWAQIIAWDLFISRWMYLDSRTRQRNPLVMGPILMLTVLLSPVGLPLYLAVRKRVDQCGYLYPRPTAEGGEGMTATTITCSHLAFRASARGSTALL